MDSASEETREIAAEQPSTSPSLWAGVIGAPSLWAIDLTVRYAVVPVAAAHGNDRRWLIALSIAFLIGTVVCGFICWREWRGTGLRVPDGIEPPPSARRQFLAATGLASSVLFSMLVIAMALPDFFIDSRID